jgi:hypothetical protein
MNIRSFDDLASILIQPESAQLPVSNTGSDVSSNVLEKEKEYDEDGDSYANDADFEDDFEEEDEEVEQLKPSPAKMVYISPRDEDESRGSLGLSVDELDDSNEDEVSAQATGPTTTNSAATGGHPSHAHNTQFRVPTPPPTKPPLGPKATTNYNTTYDVKPVKWQLSNPSTPPFVAEDLTSHYSPSLADIADDNKERERSRSRSPRSLSRSLSVSLNKQDEPLYKTSSPARVSDTAKEKSAEIKRLSKGVYRGYSDVRRVKRSDVPHLEEYLRRREFDEYNDRDENDASQTSSNDIAGFQQAFTEAGLHPNKANTNTIVSMLTRLMEQASGNLSENADMRRLLNRRSRRVQSYTTSVNGARSAVRNDIGKDKHVTKDPFAGVRYDEGTVPNVLHNIDVYDPDYDAVVDSDEIKLSAELQGMRYGHKQREMLRGGFSALEKRLDELEARSKVSSDSGNIIYAGDDDNYNNNDKASQNKDKENIGQPSKALELSLMTAMSLEKMPKAVRDGTLLRTGTDKVALMTKAQEIYASFLSDVSDQCRQRAQGAVGVEEMAMFRVLAEEVRKGFTGMKQIESIQNSMVAAAIEVSLRTL